MKKDYQPIADGGSMIEFDDVSSEKGGRLELRHVSFCLMEKEFAFLCTDRMEDAASVFIFLLSPGSGYKGSVKIGGEDAAAIKAREKNAYVRRFGVVAPGIGLAQRKTVYENMLLPANIAGPLGESGRKRLAEIMALCGVRDLARRYPSELTAIQKTKALIARSLANGPQAVLAFGATQGFDFIDSMEIIRLLFDVNLYGPAVLMATDNPVLVASLDKRILLLENGALRQDRKARLGV